jgi:hypothetical protein
MSPEQVCAKELDARTDLFSFGAVLYEMATGTMPFRGESSGVIFKAILDGTPTSTVRLNPDLPSELERIINKCLEKDRSLRYQTAAELAVDLKRLKREIDSGRSSALSASAVAAVPVPARRSRGKIAAVVAPAVIVVLAVVYLFRPTLPPPRITGYTQITHDGQQKWFSYLAVTNVVTDGPRIYVQENIGGAFRDSAGVGRRGRYGADCDGLSQYGALRHLRRQVGTPGVQLLQFRTNGNVVGAASAGRNASPAERLSGV